MSFTVDDSTLAAVSSGSFLLFGFLTVIGIASAIVSVYGLWQLTQKNERKYGLWVAPIAFILATGLLTPGLSMGNAKSEANVEFAKDFENAYGVQLVKETFVSNSGFPTIPSPNEPVTVLLSKDDSYYTTTITFVRAGNEWTALAPAGSAARLTSLDEAFSTGTLVAEEPLSSDR